MIERYIIQDLIFQKYWSKEHRDFKSIIFASQYPYKEDAERVIKNELTAGSYTIIKIYRK